MLKIKQNYSLNVEHFVYDARKSRCLENRWVLTLTDGVSKTWNNWDEKTITDEGEGGEMNSTIFDIILSSQIKVFGFLSSVVVLFSKFRPYLSAIVFLRGQVVVVVNADPVRPIEDKTYVRVSVKTDNFSNEIGRSLYPCGYPRTNIPVRSNSGPTGLRNRPSSSVCRARTWCLTKCYWSVSERIIYATWRSHFACLFVSFRPSENNGRIGTVTFWRDDTYVSQTNSTRSRWVGRAGDLQTNEARHTEDFEIYLGVYNFYFYKRICFFVW